MRRIGFVPMVALAVTLATAVACGSDDSSGEDPTSDSNPEMSADPETSPDPETSTVDLDVTVDADLGTGRPAGTAYPPEAEGLVAEYTVTNNSDVPILVAERRGDILVRDIGRPVPDDEETTWVYAAENGVIQLTKELFGRTEDAEVSNGTAWNVPAVRVGPGESISGHAFALLPLTAIVPAADEFELPGSAELSAEAATWRFCVQVAPDPQTSDDAVIYDYTPDRRLLCSDDAALPSGAVDE